MRYCEGAGTWRDAQGIWREFTLGGGMELDIQSKVEISRSEKKIPHDIHGCLLLLFTGIYYQIYISSGKKNNIINISTNSNISF